MSNVTREDSEEGDQTRPNKRKIIPPNVTMKGGASKTVSHMQEFIKTETICCVRESLPRTRRDGKPAD